MLQFLTLTCLSQAHVDFSESKIKIEGPPEEVRPVKSQLEVIVADMLKNMTFEVLQVDSKHSKHIIGKSGANSKCRVFKFSEILKVKLKLELFLV